MYSIIMAAELYSPQPPTSIWLFLIESRFKPSITLGIKKIALYCINAISKLIQYKITSVSALYIHWYKVTQPFWQFILFLLYGHLEFSPLKIKMIMKNNLVICVMEPILVLNVGRKYPKRVMSVIWPVRCHNWAFVWWCLIEAFENQCRVKCHMWTV